MPAPLDVDRDAVKAHALTHGLTEAAQAFGIPVGTVKAWSGRDPEGPWFAKAGKVQVIQPLPKSMQPVQPKVKIGAVQAQRNSLERLGARSKLSLARFVDKASKRASQLKGDHALAAAGDVVQVAKVGQAIRLPGFEQAQQPGPMLGISLSVQVGGDAPAVDVDATVVRGPTE